MKKRSCKAVQAVLFLMAGLLALTLLLYLWLTPNTEVLQLRSSSGYTTVEEIDYDEITENGNTVRHFRFTVDEDIAYDTTLIFLFNHQNADVYLQGERVYSLHTSEKLKIVKTPGCNWAMIPLFREDAGKEVSVELRPVYADYSNQEIRFIIGSRLSVYTEELLRALPQMLLSLADVFSGLLLLTVAVYFSVKKHNVGGLYALAALAASLGLWNFTQTDFAPLIMPERNTFLFYTSLIMLTFSVFALIKSVRLPEKRKSRVMLEVWAVIYAVFVIAELVLQLLGIADLRELLKFIHAALIITSVILIYGNLMKLRYSRVVEEKKRSADFLWILGVGVLLDLLNYYTGEVMGKLVFVLSAVFVYVLSEGVRILTAYIRQRKTIEEKDAQLTLSRATAMLSQIRSHFVFNVLNAVSGMCKYDPEKADETLVRFSRYLRNNIDIMESDGNVPFRTELNRLEDYVALEQVRFGDRIVFEEDLQTEDFEIPPLILQPIVENAIKHGICKRADGGKIVLSTRDPGDETVITVTDNGVGFTPEKSGGKGSVGLKNISFRLKHSVGGEMDIKSKPGEGTTVTLTIPKNRGGG